MSGPGDGNAAGGDPAGSRTPEPPNPRTSGNGISRPRLIATLCFGAAVIAVAAPLVQLATGHSGSSDLETASPPPIALGLVAGLAFLGLPLLLVARLRLFTHAQLALLFAMFAIALPLVNLGLVRPFYQGLLCYAEELVLTRVDTAAHAWDRQPASHVPKVELHTTAADGSRRVLDPASREAAMRDAGLLAHWRGVAVDAAQAAEWKRLGWRDRLSWVLAGREVADGRGGTRFSQGIPWNLWALPLLLWAAFFALVYGAFMCLAEWLRRRWIEREHLAFPLVEIADAVVRADLDLEGAREGEPPRRRRGGFSPLLLAGMLLGGAVISVEAIGYYFTGSNLLISYNLSSKLFTEPPLKSLEGVVFVLSPMVLGIAYLVALELSFSIWSMYAALLAVVLITRMAGVNIEGGAEVGWGAGRFPFIQEQGIGALVALTAVVLWKGLRRPAGGGAADATVPAPPRRRRLLPFLLAACVGLAVAHLWAYGVRSWVALALIVGLVGAIALAQARLRAETGLPTLRSWPDLISLGLIFGLGAAIGSGPFALMATLFFLPAALLTATLAQQIENFELGRRVGLRPATIAGAGALAFGVAIVVGGLSWLVLMPMTEGGLRSTLNTDKAHIYGIWTSHFRGFNGIAGFDVAVWPRIAFMAIGAAVFAALVLARARLARFPWHPLAYPLLVLGVNNQYLTPYSKRPDGTEVNWTTFLWGSVFVAWLIKALVVKYGGMDAYRRSKPLFIGLVVGSALAFCLWAVLHAIGHQVVPKDTGSDLWKRIQSKEAIYSSGGY